VVVTALIRSKPSIAAACRMLVTSRRAPKSGELASRHTSAEKAASIRNTSWTSAKWVEALEVSCISFRGYRAIGRQVPQNLRNRGLCNLDFGDHAPHLVLIGRPVAPFVEL
jgi:hypothetical protein